MQRHSLPLAIPSDLLELRVTNELAEQPLDPLRGGTAGAEVLKDLGDLALSVVAPAVEAPVHGVLNARAERRNA